VTRRDAWYEHDERGSASAVRAGAWLYRRFGQRMARVLVVPIVAYFYATGSAARRASLDYLRRVYQDPDGARVLAGPPRQRHVFLHFLAFGTSIVDRMGFWLGTRSDYALAVTGEDHLDRVARDGRGALVLGSHLGSFDAMRLLATGSRVTVNILMYTQHAARINALFDRLGALARESLTRVRVIPVRTDSFDHVLAARACVERGEVVAILADRSPPSGVQRDCSVAFLGGRAAIPQGPFRLAAALACPVLFMVALRTGDRAYSIDVELLSDRIELPRKGREQALASYCQRYADRLARHCLRAPYQWFNFYDFFRDGVETPRE